MVRPRPILAAALAILGVAPAARAVPYDRPLLASDVQGHAKIVTYVVAGNSGAPAGFTVQWMRFADFLDNGGQFHDAASPEQGEAVFTGAPTVNTWGGLLTTFVLGPDAVAAVEIGDLFDETGVARNATAELELQASTPYIFRARANGDAAGEASDWSNVFIVQSGLNLNCTYTQGYWKNHPDDWPVGSLTLGSVTYTKAQLVDVLHEPAHGNGLVILAHQLIATLLNVALGADDTDVASAVSASHALIGGLVVPPVGTGSLSPSSASALAQTLDDYNNGIIGPGHCGAVPVERTSWGRAKSMWR
jgi:hypothetical protein